MTTDSLRLYKLIILYFLYRSDGEITNAILSDFILKNNYTSYFSIQETLSTLTEDNLISAHKTHASSFYKITEKGKEMLDFFYSKLPADTIRQIDSYLSDHKIQMKRENSIRTDYEKISSSEYMVTGTISERSHLLAEVSLSLPTEEAALKACERFKKKSTEIYSALFKALSTD